MSACPVRRKWGCRQEIAIQIQIGIRLDSSLKALVLIPKSLSVDIGCSLVAVTEHANLVFSQETSVVRGVIMIPMTI
jgi:hypothetical protein